MGEVAKRHWSERLRQERIRRNWRQQDLADQLGTTVITIKRWERGRQLPSSYFAATEGLPLALDQAGAYIEESGCNLAHYRKLYQEHTAPIRPLTCIDKP